ncbi:hypothetical protein PanWU01x14_231370 [Parasponia andersonii]|uniref:Cyclin-dependent kinase inhibitor n=1 Tax=Parasponia andersonii TaxID=3476 RepID=A0A2P5BKD4_PARAD|nr:hypothetical protein PanWU01x14_231370 [Parasponia andersonii]
MAPTAMRPSSTHKQKRQQQLVESAEIEKMITSMEMPAAASGFIISSRESSSIMEKEDIDEDGDEGDNNKGCSTPKAKRYKIPGLLSCPPPPKKRKVSPRSSSHIAFFAPPDLELFFLFAFRKSS